MWLLPSVPRVRPFNLQQRTPYVSVRAVTFDLQQVLQSPSMSVSALYYKWKLSRDILVDGTAKYCWSPDTLFRHLRRPESQDKLCCNVATTVLPISTIDHIYMESGHSQIECNSVIVPLRKPREQFPFMHQWIITPSLLAHVINNGMWSIQWHRLISHITGETAVWLRMKWIQYRKEAPWTLAFKHDYDEPFQEMQVNAEKAANTAKDRQRRRKRGKSEWVSE